MSASNCGKPFKHSASCPMRVRSDVGNGEMGNRLYGLNTYMVNFLLVATRTIYPISTVFTEQIVIAKER